jgi:hypothetical protein
MASWLGIYCKHHDPLIKAYDGSTGLAMKLTAREIWLRQQREAKLEKPVTKPFAPVTKPPEIPVTKPISVTKPKGGRPRIGNQPMTARRTYAQIPRQETANSPAKSLEALQQVFHPLSPHIAPSPK